jgi:multidrug efflux pump subunit AcrA (membrane-fusion protein)
LTGVVNAIYVSRGELIRSGQPLFNLRLTHQDLVKTQSDFLAALGRMDVEQREIQRLTEITKSGAVAGKNLIQREYEYDRLQAEVRAERQAMLLHGLSEAQIAAIEQRRQLVREVTVYAPTLHGDDSLHHESESPRSILPPGEVPVVTEVATGQGSPGQGSPGQGSPAVAPSTAETAPDWQGSHEHVEAEFLVTALNVNRGQSVSAGESLGRLSDYSMVLIEGHAFQKDGTALRTAAKFKLPVQAVFDSSAARPEIVDGLGIWYIGSEVGIDSRTLPFFVMLKNQVERSEQRGPQRYVSWKFKPGQRLQLRVPQQGFEDTIVVPKDAVAEEGFERYVFVDHGDHFDRRPVRVLARDDLWVAIRNDGSIRSGQSIAISGAHQLQMAMKNQSGGPIDPHAGHNH